MSSMVSRFTLSALLIPAMLASVTCHANVPPGDGSEWDAARAALVDPSSGNVSAAVAQWQNLRQSDNWPFRDYASFLVTYPGWPDEAKFRRNAEKGLESGGVSEAEIITYFDRMPPLTNTGKAKYALALQSVGRSDDARDSARAAWASGALTDADEYNLAGLFSSAFTPDDHDKRMDALLWANARAAAERQLGLTSNRKRAVFGARLALLGGAAANDDAGPDALSDAGYIYQRANMLRDRGDAFGVRNLLAVRPTLATYPVLAEKWYEMLLRNARDAASDGQYSLAYEIASKVDDAFPAGTDISNEPLGVRDDYTSLAWLAGTTALWELNNPSAAVAMFARYGTGARTPQTRSKGFYWAGLAAERAGDATTANQYYGQAAQYGDHYYGQLALERLGLPIPDFSSMPQVAEAALDRGAFNANPLVQATQLVSRTGDWRTETAFYRALAASANTEAETLLVADFAKSIGRRDLGVILGQSARTKGLEGFQFIAFPQIPVPPGYDDGWTFIHAITRQESQFAQDAVSSAGARGLMQLMPGTAREQAGKTGLSYSAGDLHDSPSYNIQLGSGYFSRMLDYYGGSYPLAVAAYNAGPGNVNKWLRANGDPRTGAIDIVRWVELIPIFETKNYVQRVLENAVVYDTLVPAKATYRGPNPLSHYLGKGMPG